MDADRTTLNGKPVDPEAADCAIECFIEPMLDVFRLVRDEKTRDRVIMAYALHLARFDKRTLELALEWFEGNRKDPFMPTIAECVERCDLIYGQSDEAQLSRAFSRLYPIGGGPREMWPQQLGPEPGKPGCRIPPNRLEDAWFARLDWFRNLVLGKIGGVSHNFRPPQSSETIGLGIFRQLLNEYDIDTTKPPHPIPLSVLLEFNVPTDMEDVESRMQLDASERAAAVDQRQARH